MPDPTFTFDRKCFINYLIDPIQRFSTLARLTLEKDHIYGLSSTEGSVVYAQIPIQTKDLEEPIDICLKDISKLKSILSIIKDDEITLKVKSNYISYSSNKRSFKCFVLDNHLVPKCPISDSAIRNAELTTNFLFTKEIFTSLLKSLTFASEADRCNLYQKDKSIFAELICKGNENTDSITIMLSENYSGEPFAKPISLAISDLQKVSNNFLEGQAGLCRGAFGIKFENEQTNVRTIYLISSRVI